MRRGENEARNEISQAGDGLGTDYAVEGGADLSARRDGAANLADGAIRRRTKRPAAARQE